MSDRNDDDRDRDQQDDGEDGAGVAMLCRRCGDDLLDFQEEDEVMQGWCDGCGEWVEPSAQPDDWDEENELEYDVSDLDHARRTRLVALLDADGTPFVWDPEHVLVVMGDDEDDVDQMLDAVGVDPDVAFAPQTAPMRARAVTGGDDDVDEDDDDEDEDEDDDEDDGEDDGDDDGEEDWEETPLDDDAAEDLADALEDLAVVVRQVRRDVTADVDVGVVSQVYSLIAGSPAPYGYTDQHWSELIAATAALARAVNGGKASDRTVAALRLQRVLPGA